MILSLHFVNVEREFVYEFIPIYMKKTIKKLFSNTWLCSNTSLDSLRKKILSSKNIAQAIVEVCQKFDETSKTYHYRGIDGLTLGQQIYASETLICQIQVELKSFQVIDPVQVSSIAKSTGGTRMIYTYTVKERIKAQAIYRQVQYLFEPFFSPNLYSYRTGYAHHKIVRDLAKRYQRHYGKDYVFRTDITSYTESLDVELLKVQLQQMKFDTDVYRWLCLYMNNDLCQDGAISSAPALVTGVPIVGLFANLYLSNMDHLLSKHVAFYRRMGDDIVMADLDQLKMQVATNMLQKTLSQQHLSLSEEKTYMGLNTTDFELLGYVFSGRKLRIRPSSVDRFLSSIRSVLSYRDVSLAIKQKYFHKVCYHFSKSLHVQTHAFLSAYRCVTDQQQVHEINAAIWKYIARYFWKQATPHNVTKTKQLLKDMPIPLFSSYFFDFYYGRSSLAQINRTAKEYA